MRLNDFTGHGNMPIEAITPIKGARIVKLPPPTRLWDITVTFQGGVQLVLCVEAKDRTEADGLIMTMLTAVPQRVRIKRYRETKPQPTALRKAQAEG